MTFWPVVLLAALNASGLMRSPTQINQRDGVNLEKLSKSALDGLPEEEASRRWAEHERVGRDLSALLGFEFGKPVTDYGFTLDAEQPDDPTYPVYVLGHPVSGFTHFRPLPLFGRLCGVLLTRQLPPGEDEEQNQAWFAEADFAVCTNLATTVGLCTNNLSIATNGVPHVWRISLERWRQTQVLRIGDGELVARLVRAVKAEKEAEKVERIHRLMHSDESVEGAKPALKGDGQS